MMAQSFRNGALWRGEQLWERRLHLTAYAIPVETLLVRSSFGAVRTSRKRVIAVILGGRCIFAGGGWLGRPH